MDDLRAREAAMVMAQLLVTLADDPNLPVVHRSRAEMYRLFSERGLEDELRAQGRWHPESALGLGVG